MSVKTRDAKGEDGHARDVGLALVLLSLIVIYFAELWSLLPLSILLVLCCAVCPQIFQPVVVPWYGLSRLLGGVVSHIVLTLLYYGVVTPVGLCRRLLGGDSMQRRRWKDGPASVFRQCGHQITAKDLKHPY